MGYPDLFFDFSGEKGENNDGKVEDGLNKGIECSLGDYNLNEYDELKSKLYGFGGSYENEKEVLQDQHRLEKLGICNAGRIGLRKLNNEHRKNNGEGDLTQKKEIIKLGNNINYLDYIDENGLSEEIKDIIMRLWENLGLKEIDKKDKKKFYKGFVFLLKLFASIESDGKNIENTSGSSAKGYFQYLNGFNKKGNKDKKYNKRKGLYTPFETALRKVNKYYVPDENYPTFNNAKLPKWVKKAYNKEDFNPINLTLEQQTILFLIDLLTKTKKVYNKNHNLVGIKDYLPLAINGNEWAIKNIYYIFHHTNPDNDTKVRTGKKINSYRTNLMALNK